MDKVSDLYSELFAELIASFARIEARQKALTDTVVVLLATENRTAIQIREEIEQSYESHLASGHETSGKRFGSILRKSGGLPPIGQEVSPPAE